MSLLNLKIEFLKAYLEQGMMLPHKEGLKMLAEIQRLRSLCENVHDRLLRGQEDTELMAMLDEANDPDVSELMKK